MKILIVGYGSIGKRHAKNLLKLGHELIIYSNRDDLKKNNKIKVYNNIIKCIKCKPKVALITNETSKHIPIALKLAKKNIHLFIEKPLSNSKKDIHKLIKIVSKRKLITMVGCNMRFHECINQIKKLLENKRIGKIISVQVENGSYLPDWHPYEDYRNSYASRKELGGGVVLTCIHEIDYLYWFFGQVTEVFSISEKVSHLKISVEDLSAIIMRFKNGPVAEIHLDYFQRQDIERCKVIGTKGTILWDSTKNQVLLYDIKKGKWIKEFELKRYYRNDMFVKEMIYFLNCVKKQKKSMNSILENSKVLEIALKIKHASKLKRIVNI